LLCSSHEPSTTEIDSLSLHDALPICDRGVNRSGSKALQPVSCREMCLSDTRRCSYAKVRRSLAIHNCWQTWHPTGTTCFHRQHRSEERTSELQSRENLVCRLLLEQKK